MSKKKEHCILELNNLKVKGHKIDNQIQKSNALKFGVLNPYNDDFLNLNHRYFSKIQINKSNRKIN